MSDIYESAEMIGYFLDEVEEQLQFLEHGILDLEKENGKAEVIQEIFRVAHTLKGASSAMGYEKMTLLTHSMENVLDKIRNNPLIINTSIINTLFSCMDCLRLLKEAFIIDKNNTKVDITKSLEELSSIFNSKTEDEWIQDTNKPLKFENWQKSIFTVETSLLDGENCFVCDVKIFEDSLMKSTRACLIANFFNEIGKVIASNPNVMELPDGSDISRIQYLVITELNEDDLEKKCENGLMDVEQVAVYPYKIDSLMEERKVEENSKEICSIRNDDSKKSVLKTVRVDIERLEHMMNLVGEMVIEQTRIAQVGNLLHNRYTSDNTVDDLMGISNHISRVVGELQENVMKARMVPIQQLFNRFPRMVRDLGQSLGKEIGLHLEGGETEMDRTIIEDITDPLIHILRNSIDHGLEAPEIRQSKGKPLVGKIAIRAFYQENHAAITIEDDGAGLNLEKIKSSAVRKEVISFQEAENLNRHEIINLIFKTGLSTAENVSDVSGRGVGMDIVRNHIDKLNGIIDVETVEGEGTKFTVKLPLTLAILTGLLVKICDETYALPMTNVIEIVRKPKSEIQSVKKESVVVIRDRIHPVIWLHDYFNLPRPENEKNVFIVVLGVAEKRFGIVVDELIGNQEIVVKPLGSYIGKVQGLSGATIVGDGSVACILDVGGISTMISNQISREIIETSTKEN